MGVLIDGEWDPNRDRIDETETDEFVRSASTFRGEIRPGGPHPPAADRYHLYVSRACPWAHRTTIVRTLTGLSDAVTVDILDPIRRDDGWAFSPEQPGCTADTVNGCAYLRDVYTLADPAYSGRVTTPVLWDREAATIVNNESSEIIRFLDEEFNDVANRDVSLFPADGRARVISTIEELYAPINDGVYRAGFAKSQRAYDTAVEALFAALSTWNDRLAERRYLCGERLTAADVCLFTTLYRFDEVYHTHFKCNGRRITDFDHLWGHTREIYQLLGVAETCNMHHCKAHYYRSHRDLNPGGLVPVGSAPAFEDPPGRTHLPGGPPAALTSATD